jgi:hypothetical protein
VNDEALLESGLDVALYELSILGTSWVSYSMLKNATKRKEQPLSVCGVVKKRQETKRKTRKKKE